jgi:hypothetical protein
MASRNLVTQAEYARMRGISREAVNRRTVTHGGPIPVHGRAKRIDPAQADALWHATMDGRRLKSGQSRARIPDQPDPGPAAFDAVTETLESEPDIAPVARAAGPAAQAKMASALIKAQTDKIQLEKLKGALIDKPRALRLAFGWARRNRDAWLNWPSRVGPEMAARLGVDQHLLTVELERYVREHLTQLADQPLDL